MPAIYYGKPVVSEVFSRKERAAFFAFPTTLAPLRSIPVVVEKYLLSPSNPYRRFADIRLFICTIGTRITARAAYIADRRTNVAYFGFFDAENISDTTAILLQSLEDIARADGKNRLEGCYNPQHYSPSGILLNCFDKPPSLYQTWNPPYYATLLVQAGFTEYVRGRIWRNHDVQSYLRKEAPAGDFLQQSGRYSVRHLPVSGNALSSALDIINGSFGNNLRFQEISDAEFRYTVKLLFPALEHRLTAVAYADAVPVGAAICLNDISLIPGVPCGNAICDRLRVMFSRRPPNLIVLAIGMLPEHRGSRAVLLLRNALALMARRYSTVDSSWITVGNYASEQMAERFGMTPHKEYAIFGKNLV